MSEERKRIRDAVKWKLHDAYASGSGPMNVVRHFESGQRSPGRPMFPSLTVQGGAQARAQGVYDTETEKTVEYEVLVLLELEDNWDSGDRYDFWEIFVQDLITRLWNWLPIPGALRFDYVGDENPDEQLVFGPSETIWVIRFVCTYMVQVGEIGKED